MSSTSKAPLTLVILAAGLGSRYGGLKQLDRIGPAGETLMDYAIHDAARAGFTDVVFIIRPEMAQEFMAFASAHYGGKVTVRVVHQRLDDLPPGTRIPAGRAKPWGTGQAVLAAQGAVTGPFVVQNSDDFYGAPPYEAARRFFEEAAGSSPPVWGVVGYRLGETLSDSGGVNRGVCRESSGWLTSLEEVMDIVGSTTGRFVGRGRNGPVALTGRELVSMNMWAFTPDVFAVLAREFSEFLAAGESATREFLLPYAVRGAIRRGDARVRVLDPQGLWFGMTHPADRPRVQAALLRLRESGAYPERLW